MFFITSHASVRKFLILVGGIISLFGCTIGPLPVPGPPTLATIPDHEIVFKADDYQGLGFVNSDGSSLEFYNLTVPSPLSDRVRWSFDSESIVGQVVPSVNPNTTYPMLVRSDGQILICEIVGNRGSIWGLDDTQVIIEAGSTGQILIVDMETCDILSVIYENEVGVSLASVSPHGWVTVRNFTEQLTFSLDDDTQPDFDLPDDHREWSQDGRHVIVVIDDQPAVLNVQTGESTPFKVDGGWWALSPDGEAVVYAIGVSRSDITILDLISGESTQVASYGRSPSWRRLP